MIVYGAHNLLGWSDAQIYRDHLADIHRWNSFLDPLASYFLLMYTKPLQIIFLLSHESRCFK